MNNTIVINNMVCGILLITIVSLLILLLFITLDMVQNDKQHIYSGDVPKIELYNRCVDNYLDNFNSGGQWGETVRKDFIQYRKDSNQYCLEVLERE